MFSVLFIAVFLIFRAIGQKNKTSPNKLLATFASEIEGIIDIKKALALAVFKVLPLLTKIHKNMVLLFCMLYPVFMGAIQKTMDLLDSKCDLQLDSIAEM